MSRLFRCVSDRSGEEKDWSIEITGNTLTIRFGKTSAPRKQARTVPITRCVNGSLQDEMQKRISAKLSEGYFEVTDGAPMRDERPDEHRLSVVFSGVKRTKLQEALDDLKGRLQGTAHPLDFPDFSGQSRGRVDVTIGAVSTGVHYECTFAGTVGDQLGIALILALTKQVGGIDVACVIDGDRVTADNPQSLTRLRNHLLNDVPDDVLCSLGLQLSLVSSKPQSGESVAWF